MPKKRLPDLPDTGRHYVENTIRARLHSPGIEKYRTSRRGGAPKVLVAVLVAVAILAEMAWLAGRM